RLVQRAFHHFLDCEDAELAIATPGPSKMAARKQFRDVWDEAAEALKHANQVFVVGYSFPLTDAEARHVLLDALGQNTNERAHLALHVVLGDDMFNAGRVDALLRFIMRGRVELDPAQRKRRVVGELVGMPGTYSLEVHPLFAQDFLTVATKARLDA